MDWIRFPFYELGQQEPGQGCIRKKCVSGRLDPTTDRHSDIAFFRLNDLGALSVKIVLTLIEEKEKQFVYIWQLQVPHELKWAHIERLKNSLPF